jgi:excisionase family DNA binding protein
MKSSEDLLLDKIRMIIREELHQIQTQPTEIMSVDQCAEYLNLTPQTIYKRSQIDLPCSRTGKRIYFLKADVDKWLLDNKKPTLKELYEARR